MNTYELNEICDIFDGPHATPPESLDGPIYLGIKNINEACELDFATIKHLSNEDYIKWTKRVTPREDDIVFSYEATLNRYALIPNGFHGCLGRRLAIARVKNRDIIDPHYLFYYFCTEDWKKFILANKVVGSTVLRVSVEDFPYYKVTIPDIVQQKATASILDAITTKIATNNRIIKTSEKLMREIYDYWFVQFDFPDENGRPYKSSNGEMFYDEKLKQKIPKGWSSAKLSSILDMTKRGDWGSDVQTEQDDMRVFCIRGTDLDSMRRGPIITSTERYISSKHEERILKKGDFVIEISGTPGRSAYINDGLLSQFDSPLISSNFCQIVTPIKPEMLYWFTNLWTSLYESDVANNYSGQTTMKNLQFDILANSTSVVLPDNNSLKRFHVIAERFYDYIQLLIAENKELASLRDWLLPMLMNGQIKVIS